MIAVLNIIASFLGWAALFMAAWAVIPREPRLMTAALGLAALSLVYASGAAAYQHHYEAVVLGGIGVILVAALTWRTWPHGLNPWRQFRAGCSQLVSMIMQVRIAGNKES